MHSKLRSGSLYASSGTCAGAPTTSSVFAADGRAGGKNSSEESATSFDWSAFLSSLFEYCAILVMSAS